jgi:hypothetical protein
MVVEHTLALVVASRNFLKPGSGLPGFSYKQLQVRIEVNDHT